MLDLIYDFQVGGAAFASQSLLTRRVVPQLELTAKDGWFYDLMGDGFIFGETIEHGLVALVADPVLMCPTSMFAVPDSTGWPNVRPLLVEYNLGRRPWCKTIMGKGQRDLAVCFSGGHEHENQHDNDGTGEQSHGVSSYRPAGANWRLTTSAGGVVLALEVFDYLARFWDGRRSQLITQRAGPTDYAIFARYFGLLADLESAELDADEIAPVLHEFGRTTLADASDADVSSSERLQLLRAEIDAYADFHRD